MEVPDAGKPLPLEQLRRIEALQLFRERAVAVQPGFEMGDHNARLVAHVCRRLDGIPLAIELAAARVNVLGLQQIADRLDDCFRLLTGGSRSAAARQQTLRATLDWSYALLSPAEQRLFNRLSVFTGGWTIDAAEAVGAGNGVESTDVLDLLARLVARSLVVAKPARDGTVRYRLLETVRQYALERLATSGETTEARDRHAAFFSAIAGPRELISPQQSWLHRLAAANDNLRAALGWLMEASNPEPDLRMTASLRYFWGTRANAAREAREWFERALSLSGSAPTPLRARLLSSLAMNVYSLGDLTASQRALEEAVAIDRACGDPEELAVSLFRAGKVARDQGNWTRAQELLEESARISLGLGHQARVNLCQVYLGWLAHDQGNFDAALELAEEVVPRSEETRVRFAEQGRAEYTSGEGRGLLSALLYQLGKLTEARVC